MTALTRWRSHDQMERQLQTALTRQLGNIQLATALTQISIREISTIHQTAATTVAQTLKQAQAIIDQAARVGRMTPEKEAAVAYMTRTYLDQMLVITDFGSRQITQLLLIHSTRR